MSFGEDSARWAAVFLAQAPGTLTAELRLRGELPDEAEHHLALCDTIEETFSFAVAHHHRLASLRADFSAHFDEQKERRLSILESAPERSLDTVLTPESYAAGYFRSGALINGIRITVGDDLASRLALAPPGLSSYDSLVRMRADQAGWNLVGGWWTAFARLALGLDPGDDMPWSSGQ